MDRDDLELFERSVRNATSLHSGAELDAALTELGWSDACDADPRAAVSVLFELQGWANVTSSAIDRLVLGAVGLDPDAGGLVWPATGSSAPPATLTDERLTITAGLGSAALATSATVVVVADAGGDEVAITVPTAALTIRAVDGVDPELGLVAVHAERLELDGPATPVDGWSGAVALAQLAVGHELVGVSRRMLALAREHALERVQFGQPISMFQAVRHRLADTLVAIETADAVLDAAWLDGSSATAAMAKALAGRGARTASRHCQQVLAGIGFTTEHTLHRYIRRALVLDELFGSARSLTRRLGDDVLADRVLPAQLPL